jgi:RHS repeat-associated protein
MAGTANAISFVWDGTDLLNEYVSGALSGRYLTLDGEVLSEKRGASRFVYGVDPLGSVVHLLDSSLNRAGTYVYWPYGEVQSHTGVDTPLQYIGNLGYHTSTTNRVYMRARDLRPDLGRWLTQDPLMEGIYYNAFQYVGASPASFVDPSGLIAIDWNGCNETEKRRIRGAMDELCGSSGGSDAFRDCLDKFSCGVGFPGDIGGNHIGDCVAGFCGTTDADPKKLRISCCGGWQPCNIYPCWGACSAAVIGKEIVVCARNVWDTRKCDRLACVLAHEMIHVCGIVGHPGAPFECVRKFDDRCTRTAD